MTNFNPLGGLCNNNSKFDCAFFFLFRVNFNGLPEEIRKKPIAEIQTIDIDAILKEVKPRKYEELRTLFNEIFKYAVASGIITHNPVALIKFKRAKRQSRESLSKGEIVAFLERIK